MERRTAAGTPKSDMPGMIMAGHTGKNGTWRWDHVKRYPARPEGKSAAK